MATKYSGRWCIDGASESIALFSDKVSLEAMGAFIGAEFECGNSLYAPCDAIRVIDLTTGEIVLEAEVGDGDDDDYADWDYNEDMGFDPYLDENDW